MENIRENNLPLQNGRNSLPTLENPYRGLTDIDDTPDPSQSEREQLERLADFMAKEGMTERFGITLLHDHFPVSDDEILIEFYDAENRTLTTRPCPKTDLAKYTQAPRETQWRWDNASGLLCLIHCINNGQGHGGTHIPLLK